MLPSIPRWTATLPTRLLLPVILATLGGLSLLVVSGSLWLIHNNGDMIESQQYREGRLLADGLANAVAPELVQRNYGGIEARLLQPPPPPTFAPSW